MQEEHQYQFRGVWLPADVVIMLGAGTLNAKEMVLLALIDALVVPGTGCYATNGYLGKRLGCSEETVRRMVQHLTDLGLLKTIGFDGRRRYLETTWSRIQTPQNCGGRPHRIVDHSIQAQITPRPPSGPVAGAGEVAVDTDHTTAPATTKQEGPDMPLLDLPQSTTQTKGHPTDEDRTWAKMLADAIATAGKVKAPYRLTAWANTFRLMRAIDGISEERIRAALGWYTTSIGGEFVPQAYSATAFREKFLNIEAAMRRAQPAPTELDADAKAVMEVAGNYQWPKGGAGLAAGVQASVTAYRAYLAGLRAVQGPRGKATRLAGHLLAAADLRVDMSRHWQEQYRRVANWQEWSGRADRLAWHLECPEAVSAGRQAAAAYCGDGDVWGSLCDLVKGITK